MLTEYADRVARAPKSLSLLEASTLPCAALTVWTALNGDRPYTNRRIGAGDKVLVLGTGGVSLFALLLTRAAGAEVIGTSSQDEKLGRVRRRGGVHGPLHASGHPPNLMSLMIKGASIRGTSVGGAAALADLVAAIDASEIKPPIDRTFAFEEAKTAYRYQTSGDVCGKIVIEVAKY